MSQYIEIYMAVTLQQLVKITMFFGYIPKIIPIDIANL